MLASTVLNEEWLADVLQDSMEMDWTTTDGARAIMQALENGLVELPQRGGQIVAFPGLEGALREVISNVADDYMTSEAPHPGYVLIPAAKFDQLRGLATRLALNEQGG